MGIFVMLEVDLVEVLQKNSARMHVWVMIVNG